MLRTLTLRLRRFAPPLRANGIDGLTPTPTNSRRPCEPVEAPGRPVPILIRVVRATASNGRSPVAVDPRILPREQEVHQRRGALRRGVVALRGREGQRPERVDGIALVVWEGNPR